MTTIYAEYQEEVPAGDHAYVFVQVAGKHAGVLYVPSELAGGLVDYLSDYGQAHDLPRGENPPEPVEPDQGPCEVCGNSAFQDGFLRADGKYICGDCRGTPATFASWKRVKANSRTETGPERPAGCASEMSRRVLAKHWPNVERFEDVRECGRHNLKEMAKAAFEVEQAILSDDSQVWNVVGCGLRFACTSRRNAQRLARGLESTAWIEETNSRIIVADHVGLPRGENPPEPTDGRQRTETGPHRTDPPDSDASSGKPCVICGASFNGSDGWPVCEPCVLEKGFRRHHCGSVAPTDRQPFPCALCGKPSDWYDVQKHRFVCVQCRPPTAAEWAEELAKRRQHAKPIDPEAQAERERREEELPAAQNTWDPGYYCQVCGRRQATRQHPFDGRRVCSHCYTAAVVASWDRVAAKNEIDPEAQAERERREEELPPEPIPPAVRESSELGPCAVCGRVADIHETDTDRDMCDACHDLEEDRRLQAARIVAASAEAHRE